MTTSPQKSAQKSDQHWHIVGQGAMGLLWAHFLNAHHPTHLILKQSTTKQSLHHYRFTSLDNKKQSLIVNRTNLQAVQRIHRLIIPVKAYDVIPALTQLLPLLSNYCIVILSHNGMGTIEQAKALLKPTQSLYFAITTHGAFKPNLRNVIHTGKGDTHIGLLQGPHTLTETSGLLPPLHWHNNLSPMLWRKLAINCVINPLTAIYNCKNGELAAAKYQNIIDKLCEEFSLVAKHSGQAVETTSIRTGCYQVIVATANNFSSMHQDIYHGRTSEIDYITGTIIQQAAQLHLNVPTHHRIYHELTNTIAKYQKLK